MFGLGACGQEESLSVEFAPQTVSEQQGKRSDLSTISMTHKFDNLEVSRPLRFPLPIPILGAFIQDFGNILANSIIIVKDGEWDVSSSEPINLDIPEIDRDVVRSIKLKSLSIEIVPGTQEPARNFIFRLWDRLRNNEADLGFIKKIQILVSESPATQDSLRNEEGHLLASYYKRKRGDLACAGNCIRFDLSDMNLVPLLNENKALYVSPIASVDKTPKWNFELRGEIEFEVELNLGF